MAPRDGDPGDRRRLGTNLLLAASDGLYGALLALYPKAFRRRYAPEMRRDFSGFRAKDSRRVAVPSW